MNTKEQITKDLPYPVVKTNNQKNSLKIIFEKYDLQKYAKTKISGFLPMFNLILTFNVLTITASIAVIVGKLIIG